MGSINLETMDMPLREWIAQDRTRREIKHRSSSLYLSRLFGQNIHHPLRFRTFLESDEHHKQAIQFMCANNLVSVQSKQTSLVCNFKAKGKF